MPRHTGLDVVGADPTGLFQGIAQFGAGITDYVQKDRAETAAHQDADQKLATAISADKAATTARARSLISTEAAKKNPGLASQAAADKAASDSASRTQDTAGAVVTDDKKKARVDAAQKAVNDAQNAIIVVGAVDDPTTRALKLQAAQETLIKAQGGNPAGMSKDEINKKASPSLLSKAIVGPVKVWHGLVGLVAVVGGTVLLRKKK